VEPQSPIRVVIEQPGGTFGQPWALENLTNMQLMTVMSTIVGELDRRGAWVGPKPRYNLVALDTPEGEARALAGNR